MLQNKRPHTIAATVIPSAAVDMVQTMFGGKCAQQLRNIPLPNNTASRRMAHISKDSNEQPIETLRNKSFLIQIDTSNIEILQRFQNKVLRAIGNAPWYVPNGLLHADLGIPTVREEVTKIGWKYKGKITIHTNEMATTLLNNEDEPR
jgi:hypothetical protein